MGTKTQPGSNGTGFKNGLNGPKNGLISNGFDENDNISSEQINGKYKNGGLRNKNNNGTLKNIKKDPMAVKWLAKYADKIDTFWEKVPSFLKPIFITTAVFLFGISAKGEWIIALVHFLRHIGFLSPPSEVQPFSWSNVTLESLYLKDLPVFIVWACFVGYVIYFLVGGFIHWYFYMRQRDRPQDWKCQPNKFMDPELERHEIIFGSLTLLCNSTVSATIACYIANGGYSAFYYNFLDYGWLWLVLQVPVFFIYQDYCAYWMHRIFHLPSLYIYFHKMHHKYKQPTAFSVTALHPVEAITMQSVMIAPIFFMPLHYLLFFAQVFYIYYHGIIDHSGVNFKAQWWQPWQPDAIFHDNHHQYFHVNFGFNISYWDKLHGTARRKDRIYTEEIFYGEGKSVNEASATEVQDDMNERLSENPLAYRSNQLDFVK